VPIFAKAIGAVHLIDFRRATNGFPAYAETIDYWRQFSETSNAHSYIDMKSFDDARDGSVQLSIKQARPHRTVSRLVILDASSDRDIETSFATFVQRGAGALMVGAGAFLFSNRERLVALAARHALPAIYPDPEDATPGGLMGYGPSIVDAYHQVGIYAGRVLKGDRPGDLPVMQSTKFDLVINMKTAKALGLTIPPGVLAIADEVIE
jgi:hypothetical protein